ncbi:hypothetical protein B0H14DRAFT_2807858 [Mycena olivaceomarginata]|nr:hypothetical protein B0H14DRAFT_2807858 [Mycena olivaceomarginata]
MDTPGRFGTIELLRQRPDAQVSDDILIASFGVDTPTVSFGRDPNCSVRLYYKAVAPLHARILFNEDGRAFVEVIGEGGVVVDGCSVFPLDEGAGADQSGSGKGESADGRVGKGLQTIALGNVSELEIHRKRFRFTYPPKDMRTALAPSFADPGVFRANSLP